MYNYSIMLLLIYIYTENDDDLESFAVVIWGYLGKLG